MQIRPFLFSWPTGTFHNYITAIKRGAEGDQTQVDFVGACVPVEQPLWPCLLSAWSDCAVCAY